MVVTKDLARLVWAGLCQRGCTGGALLWVLVEAEQGELLLAEWEFLREHPEGENHPISARLQG